MTLYIFPCLNMIVGVGGMKCGKNNISGEEMKYKNESFFSFSKTGHEKESPSHRMDPSTSFFSSSKTFFHQKRFRKGSQSSKSRSWKMSVGSASPNNPRQTTIFNFTKLLMYLREKTLSGLKQATLE